MAPPAQRERAEMSRGAKLMVWPMEAVAMRRVAVICLERTPHWHWWES